ncbi:hypothetical protein Efla_000204 [Eimeria flavescens]
MVGLAVRPPPGRDSVWSTRLARPTKPITPTRSRWLTLCLSVWLCIAVLGLCVTSTGSFRASDAGLFSTRAAQTSSSATSNKAFSIRSARHRQTACVGVPRGQPVLRDQLQVSRQSLVKGHWVRSLAAISCNRPTWVGAEVPGLWTASTGSPLQEEVVPKCIFGSPQAGSFLSRLSAVLGASTDALSNEEALQKLQGGNGRIAGLKPSKIQDLEMQQRAAERLVCPGTSTSRVKATDRIYPSLNLIRAKVEASLSGVVRSVRNCVEMQLGGFPGLRGAKSLLHFMSGGAHQGDAESGSERPSILFSSSQNGSSVKAHTVGSPLRSETPLENVAGSEGVQLRADETEKDVNLSQRFPPSNVKEDAYEGCERRASSRKAGDRSHTNTGSPTAGSTPVDSSALPRHAERMTTTEADEPRICGGILAAAYGCESTFPPLGDRHIEKGATRGKKNVVLSQVHEEREATAAEAPDKTEQAENANESSLIRSNSHLEQATMHTTAGVRLQREDCTIDRKGAPAASLSEPPETMTSEVNVGTGAHHSPLFPQEAPRARTETRSNVQKEDDLDLSTAVGAQLLLALQRSPGQQLIAIRALTAHLAAELSGSATHARALLPLPGPSDQIGVSASKEESSTQGTTVGRLLSKGLVGALQRNISTPTPKPFWPRWLQREAEPTSTQAVEQLRLKVHALELLTVLASYGADVRQHIADHTALMRTLERIATPLLADGERASVSIDAPNSSVRQGNGEPFAHLQASVSTSSTDAAFSSESEASALDNTENSANASVAKSHKPASRSLGATGEKDKDARCVEASRMTLKGMPLQARGQHASSSTPLADCHNSAPTSETLHGHRCQAPVRCASSGDSSQHLATAASAQVDASLRRTRGVSGQGPHDETANSLSTESTSQANSPGSRLGPADLGEKVLSDSSALRTTAEKLAVALLSRLGKSVGGVVDEARENSLVDGMLRERAASAAKPTWWRSFLLPFGAQQATSVAVQPCKDAQRGRLFSMSTAAQKSPATAKRCDAAEGGLRGDLRDETTNAHDLSKPPPTSHKAVSAWTQVGRFFRRLCRAGFFNGVELSAFKNEAQSKIFWIPVCLSAGDAGLWAALSAVAGEDLAAAIKRQAKQHLQASQPQPSATVGGVASLCSLGSEFLSLLQAIKIEGGRPAADGATAWGVLGVTTEQQTSKEGNSFQEAALNGMGESRGTDPEEDGPFSGDVVLKGSRHRFHVLCLLTGHRRFQDSIKTLALRTLLDAVATGGAEAKLGALETLAELLRSGAADVSALIKKELKSGNASAPGQALEESLAEAILAPYNRRQWLRLEKSQTTSVILENIQVAALDFLYALVVDNEEVIGTLQKCAALRTALERVTRFGRGLRKYSETRSDSGDSGGVGDAAEHIVAPLDGVGGEGLLFKVARGLPPIERHMKVLQEHARPLRLATILSSALGGQPKWQPRVPGQRGLRILALDGGGTRGVLTVALLKHIAASVGRELGDVFDIICGTSTGGIIAVLVGMEKASALELEALYDTLINEIFVKDSAAVAGARLVVRQAYYDESLWESLLQRAFGDTRMIEFAADESVPKVFCLSSMVSTSPAKLVVWRNYNYPCKSESSESFFSRGCFAGMSHDPQSTHMADEGQRGRYNGSCCVRVRDALRATTAAPGFFIGKKVGNEFFVDGALLANNPAAVAIAEAKALYPGVPIEVVVSIGTGQCPPERCDTRTGWDGIFNQLVNAATNTEAIHELLKDMLPESVYFRLNPEIDAVSIDETSRERLDGLKAAARRFYEDPKNKEVIQRLTDILRPAHPLEKRSRFLMRSLSAKTASAALRLRNIGSKVFQAAAYALHSPVRLSDSSFVRLLKCCLQSRDANCSMQTENNEISLPSISDGQAGTLSSSETFTSGSALEQGNPAFDSGNESCEQKAQADAKQLESADDGLLNLDAHVFPGGRRSFFAWLLRSPRSKQGKDSSGVFEMLELLGRRHLSSTNQEELESLVPLTGVRHVLHGIFQLIRRYPSAKGSYCG